MRRQSQGEREVKFPLVPPGTGDVGTFVAAVRRLSRARTVEEVMATATPAARGMLGADGITFVLREGDLCHYADEDAISPLWKGKRFPMDACISGWCMRQGRPTAIRDIYGDERIPHDAYRPTFVRSLAMVPVRREDPIAAMGAYWASEREVTAQELELLQTMADAAALAIANVGLQNQEQAIALKQRDSAHRMKNVFAVAIALVQQTRGETADDYRNALTSRLSALEQAYQTVFEAEEGAVEVGQLLQRLLSAYATKDRAEICSECGTLRLSSSQAGDIALIINELSSNAAKYGALSTAAGRVTVTCRHDERGLHLTWREHGGPPVSPPSGTGFGTKMIQALASPGAGGRVELDYPPSGFRCELLLPFAAQT